MSSLTEQRSLSVLVSSSLGLILTTLQEAVLSVVTGTVLTAGSSGSGVAFAHSVAVHWWLLPHFRGLASHSSSTVPILRLHRALPQASPAWLHWLGCSLIPLFLGGLPLSFSHATYFEQSELLLRLHLSAFHSWQPTPYLQLTSWAPNLHTQLPIWHPTTWAIHAKHDKMTFILSLQTSVLWYTLSFGDRRWQLSNQMKRLYVTFATFFSFASSIQIIACMSLTQRHTHMYLHRSLFSTLTATSLTQACLWQPPKWDSPIWEKNSTWC